MILCHKQVFFSYLEKRNLSSFLVVLCYARQLQMQPCGMSFFNRDEMKVIIMCFTAILALEYVSQGPSFLSV